MDRVVAEMMPLLRGWVAYFRLSQAKARTRRLGGSNGERVRTGKT
jgi:hypothetical protein